MRDSVDQAELEHDTPRIDRYEIANAIANEANDDPLPSYAEQDRMIAAHNQRVLNEAAAWVARPIRSEQSKRLLAAAELQIKKQYGTQFNPLDHEQTR